MEFAEEVGKYESLREGGGGGGIRKSKLKESEGLVGVSV